jgi:hypothetical protein
MTLRRKMINIYDYPEHLNPFREEDEDNNEKFNITDRNVFSPNEGKLNDSTAACRFMQWIRKLPKEAGFRRPSSRATAKLRRPRDIFSSVSSLLSRRPTTSQRTVPYTSSRPSLTPSSSPLAFHSSNSRSTFPPNDSHNTFSSSPSRTAPPNEGISLSRKKPLLVASSIENTPNDVNTARKQTTTAPEVRKALFPPSPSEKIFGEQAKYIQQGVKSKKKRRAPAVPTTCQVNPAVTILKSIQTT